MPGGDFPTRKGLFDALLSGCVPVVFQPASALTQWPWHWSDSPDARQAEQVARACVVFVPRADVLHDPSGALARLAHLATNMTLLSSKRRCINSVALRMQYNDPGKGNFPLARLPNSNAKSTNKDAVDVVLDRLLHRYS